MSILGVNDVLGAYQYANRTQKAAASGTSFTEQLQKTGKAASATGMSFEEMLKAKYPEAKYHVMDAYKIPSGIWCRNDFPFEKFFNADVDESVMNWKPSGKEPSMSDAKVQSRLTSTLGKKAIVIPPALEEKMKNDPELAKSVMQKVENHIASSDARLPGVRKSFVITFDEDGEIANFTTVSEGKITVSSSEFVEARKAREAKHAEYERIAEENAIKRKLREQQETEKYYKTASIAKEAVSAAYEANVLTETVIDNASLLG